jgi:uncharacterized 2Fe-2S/4Fe-4S cluster protein (DUF4445 family)
VSFMRHFTITFQPDGRKISIHAGSTLLEAAHTAGIILNTACGGRGICRKCTVLLHPDNKQVLACQYIIDSDLIVTVPPASRFFEQKILEHGIDREIEPTLIKPGDTAGGIYGLAFDIGTTTVVAKLIDLNDGKLITTEADFNPQSVYGDDVVSRITFAQTDEQLTKLQRLIIECINSLITNLCNKTGIDPGRIYEMTAVGNTTMTHILLRLPITQLGQAPYKAYSLDAHDVPARDLDIKINPEANVHTVENIAGFVGSDIVAAALAADINLAEQLTLLVDIGTNGELVCGDKDKLYAASCAAGPALEGARISQGSRAVDGAIEAVFISEGNVDVDVVGDRPPSSICGSGLIDAVAVMLDLGVLDSTGRIIGPNSSKTEIPPAINRRIFRRNDQPAFVIAYDDGGTPAVVLTQQDIREVQLAKAAIAAGIRLLLKKLNLKEDDIQRILLAGAFGNYIRRSSALRIGLLPGIPEERIHFVGNAASSGARMILLNRTARELAGHLAQKIQYIEIAHEPEFMNIYTNSMMF